VTTPQIGSEKRASRQLRVTDGKPSSRYLSKLDEHIGANVGIENLLAESAESRFMLFQI